MANPIAQRYLYLPSVGFCILLALTFSNVKNKKVFLLPFIILIVIYSTSTYERLKVWKNDTTLWENTVQKNPESILARINYGSSLSRIGEYKKAKKELLTALTKQGIKLSDVSTVLFLLGEAERENKNYRNAEEYFINSIKAEPKNVAAYNALGYLYLQLSSSSEFSDKKKHEFLERAIESYEYVIKLSPTFYHAIYHLGLCYIKKNDLEKAEKYFKSVIELDPERELSANAFNYLLIIEVMKIKKR
ncbi:MAG: tetratricopeptide repeat protein [Candidatus Pacearchaeota archaeon]